MLCRVKHGSVENAVTDEERPHQGKENVPLTGLPKQPSGDGEIVCRERLGGVLSHYYREAA